MRGRSAPSSTPGREEQEEEFGDERLHASAGAHAFTRFPLLERGKSREYEYEAPRTSSSGRRRR